MARDDRTPGDGEEFRATYAVRDALPTRRHAEMLFEMVVDHLGEEAWVETWNGETTRTLFRREAPGSKWILPWPLVSVTRGGREGPSPVLTNVPGVVIEPTPRPGPAPRLKDLGAGSVDMHDGPHRVCVAYGKDGRWFECSTSHSRGALSGVVAALEAKSAPPAELVASFLAGLDLARHGPGRVHLPVPLPGGVRGVWNCGLHALRDRLFRKRPARTNHWYAIDAWMGKAMGSDESRDNALRELRAEVRRVRPFPVKPEPPAEPLPEPSWEQTREEDGFTVRATLRGPGSDVPWVEPTLESTPSAVIRTGAVPARALPQGWHWGWLLGDCGNPVPAAMLWQAREITAVGDRVVEALGMDRLEDLLEKADRTAPPRPELPPEYASSLPPADCRRRTYRLLDERTGKPVEPKVVSSAWGSGIQAGTVNGDGLRWGVLRQTILGG